ALFAFAYFYFRTPFTKRFVPIRIAELLLAGGAIGNLIDRMFRGEALFKGNVVDMFYIKLIDFPVFNVADSYITIACVLLVVLVLFYYKDDEFNQMFGLPRKSTKETDLTNGKEENEDAENH
ncbi:MAG: signal peptidase II, partial [Lachnospiraceae bacterium]|nr:signal peptidase II [Lachnospiraceae bacterium]